MRRYSLARDDGTIAIEGAIGPEDVSAAAMRRSLAEHDGGVPLRVLVQSPGGDVDDGLAIYTMLRNAGRPVEVTVRWAASVAAIVCMAATRIRIVEGGSLALHDCGYRPGFVQFATNSLSRVTARDLLTFANSLRLVDAMHVDILAHRTGLPRHEIIALRRDERVLDADEAVRLGFADEVIAYA